MTTPHSNPISKPSDQVAVPSVSIDWYRAFPWWRFCSTTIAIAWRSSHILIATLGIWLTYLGWMVGAKLFGEKPQFQGGAFDSSISSLYEQISVTKFFFFANLSAQDFQLSQIANFVFAALWFALVWAIFGGVLVRRSVVELGSQSSPGWMESFRLVARRLPGLMWATTMPWCIFLVLALPVVLLGLFARLGTWAEWLSGALLAVYALVLMGAGWRGLVGLVGFPLAISAVVTERSGDGFEGFSRASAYLYQKPATIIVGVFLATLLGGSAYLMVDWAFFLARAASSYFYQFGRGANGNPQGLPTALQAFFWLKEGFLASFFWSASGALYLTLRNEVDHNDFDDFDAGAPVEAESPKRSAEKGNQNPAVSGEWEQAE